MKFILEFRSQKLWTKMPKQWNIAFEAQVGCWLQQQVSAPPFSVGQSARQRPSWANGQLWRAGRQHRWTPETPDGDSSKSLGGDSLPSQRPLRPELCGGDIFEQIPDDIVCGQSGDARCGMMDKWAPWSDWVKTTRASVEGRGEDYPEHRSLGDGRWYLDFKLSMDGSDKVFKWR